MAADARRNLAQRPRPHSEWCVHWVSLFAPECKMGVPSATIRLLGGCLEPLRPPQLPYHRGNLVRWDCPLRVMEWEQ